MSRARVAVLQVISGQLSVTAAAAEYGYSRRHLHRLLTRYRQDGIDAVEPRSRAAKSIPIKTTPEVRDRIIALRRQLTANGFDAGPVTIQWHLAQEGHHAPSAATISRILNTAGLVKPEPRKRPKSSYIRFEMAQPNEMWQSDFIHWWLADGTEVEVLNWLDDHSRYLLACTVHQPVTGETIVTEFVKATERHGIPASTLTDNGLVYTARLVGGRNAFEYLLKYLGIKQKNGSPGHPQTQGKTERFHQTQQRWLLARPATDTLAELQDQLDEFREAYNEQRPHRGVNRRTPGTAYRATPKARPAGDGIQHHFRIRTDRLDAKGVMTFRRAGKLHHLNASASNGRKRVLALADDKQVLLTDLETGEVLSRHLIEPEKSYWRDQNKAPGRWPEAP